MPGGRIVTSSALQMDESALTGESVPVERTPALADRR
jgi:magnesium-transporting ATPase (P-type)